jgi:hypothetical protein
MRLVTGSCSVLVTVLVALTGCQAAGTALDRTDMVSDLAGRLDKAATLDYLAEYQVSGGSLVTVAQSGEPRRTAYRYAGGALIITPAGTTTCSGHPTRCATAEPAGPNAPAPGTNELPKHGLIPVKLLGSLLTSAALDLSTDYQQHEGTIAGQPATCVQVHNLQNPVTSDFEACVLSDGVIGSFTGSVNGTTIEFALARYTRELPADAFDIPETAAS